MTTDTSRIIRAPRPERNFTIIDNDVIDDLGITSWRALGLLIWILRMPDDWRVDARHLSRMRGEGRDAIMKALSELGTAGYVIRTKRRNGMGYWVTDTIVYDRPQRTRKTAGQNQDGFPGLGEPGLGEPGLVTRTITKSSSGVGRCEHLPPSELAQALCDLLAELIRERGRQVLFPAEDVAFLQRDLLDARAADPAEVSEVIRWAMQQNFWSAQLTTVQRLVRSYGEIFSQYTRATAPRKKGDKKQRALQAVPSLAADPEQDPVEIAINGALDAECARPKDDKVADHWIHRLCTERGLGVLAEWRAAGRENAVELSNETLPTSIANVF